MADGRQMAEAGWRAGERWMVGGGWWTMTTLLESESAVCLYNTGLVLAWPKVHSVPRYFLEVGPSLFLTFFPPLINLHVLSSCAQLLQPDK